MCGVESSTANKMPINYLSLVNVRPFVKGLDPSVLLWFCNYLNCTFDIELDTNSPELWLHKFWTVAQSESVKFHDRLKGGELFRIGEVF